MSIAYVPQDRRHDYEGLTPSQKEAVIRAAMDQTGIESICRQLFQEAVERLNDERKELVTFYDDITNCAVAVQKAASGVTGLIENITSEVTNFVTDLRGKEQKIDQSERLLNGEKILQGVRVTRNPDIFTSFMFLFGLGFLEILGTGSIFYTSGVVDGYAPAAMFGFVISFFNILLAGYCGGYLCGRNVNYDMSALMPRKTTYLRRASAWIGSIIVIGVLVYFHAFVGIIREKETFEAVSVTPDNFFLAMQTFHSALAIGLGGVTAVIAWCKGLNGFAPRDPVLADLEKQADELLEETDDLRADIQDTIQQRQDDGIETIEDIKEDGTINDDDRAKWETGKAIFHDRIEEEKSLYVMRCAEASATYRGVDNKANGESEPIPMRDEDWDRFRIDRTLPDKPAINSEQVNELHKQLADSAKEAFEKVQQAWTKFHDRRRRYSGHDEGQNDG